MLDLIIAAALQAPIAEEPIINKASHVAGLVRTDRAKRTWFTRIAGIPLFTAKTIPGKETLFYYEWVLSDGSTVTKVETQRLEHVPDRRALNDAHPNAPVFTMGLQFTGNLVGNVIGGLVRP